MNFLYIPGASDPFYTEKSKNATTLVINEAKKRGFEEINVCSYPGHFSHDNQNILQFNSTKSIIKKEIDRLESLEIPYYLFARSYGCSPTLSVLFENNNYKNLKKVVLWGAPSLHSLYEISSFELKNYIEVGIEKGVRLSKETFDNIFPIETFVKKQTSYPIVFGIGDSDPLVPLSFYNYLKAINTNYNIRFYPIIENQGHTVTEENNSYYSLIFD